MPLPDAHTGAVRAQRSGPRREKEKEKENSAFFSLSFDAATPTTGTEAKTAEVVAILWGHSWRRRQSAYPGGRSDKDEEEKEVPSFSFSSFDAATIATAMKAAPADDAEALAKNCSGEEAADGTRGDSSTRGGRREVEWAALLLLLDTPPHMSTATDN